jgi:Tfp pilus assembly PilM family ATPase
VHAGDIELAKGVVEAGFVHKKEELVEALKELSSKYGMHYIRASLPEEKTYLFTATIDDVAPENLRDAVAFIIEENAPVSLVESVFDYEVLGRKEGKLEIRVVVSVLSKKVVETYTDIFESAGMSPVAYDIESQAIARSVILQGDMRSQLIINLSKSKTGLYVVEDGVVQFSLTPSLGTQGEGAYPDLNDLRSEVRKLFTFWNTRLDKDGLPGKKIEKVLLVGPGASDKEFANSLMFGTGVEYSWANVWINVFSFSHWVPEMPFEDSLSYATATGLALAQRNSHV